MQNPIKRWKLSPMDLESRSRWVEYSRAKDVMLKHTDRKKTPWYIVDADNKKKARLNCIAHLLCQIPYKDLKPVQIDLPPRQPNNGYRRPKKSAQRWIPEIYESGRPGEEWLERALANLRAQTPEECFQILHDESGLRAFVHVGSDSSHGNLAR